MSKLLKIGEKINNAIQAVWNTKLTIKELEEFEAYINHQETVLPIMDPSFIQKHGFKMFNEAKERIKRLKPIIQLKSIEEDKK